MQGPHARGKFPARQGGVPVKIPAGHALLYHNNLTHRGYNAGMEMPPRTLHMGYHSAPRRPTWNFYLLPLESISEPDYQARLLPRIRGMVQNSIALRHRFPSMEDTWHPGWPGAAA